MKMLLQAVRIASVDTFGIVLVMWMMFEIPALSYRTVVRWGQDSPVQREISANSHPKPEAGRHKAEAGNPATEIGSRPLQWWSGLGLQNTRTPRALFAAEAAGSPLGGLWTERWPSLGM